jgi:hypothetical protein
MGFVQQFAAMSGHSSASVIMQLQVKLQPRWPSQFMPGTTTCRVSMFAMFARFLWMEYSSEPRETWTQCLLLYALAPRKSYPNAMVTTYGTVLQ